MIAAIRAAAALLAPGTLALGLIAARPAGAASLDSIAPPVWVDDFETLEAWSAQPADGVALEIRPDRGLVGRAMRLDFDFHKGGGYAVARREVSLDLPENYRFRFRIRGECLPNDLEFKLVDSTGANVWWSNQRDFRFPAEWDSVTRKKRQITFAWGPAGGGDIRHVAAIEFAITAGSGGAGSVWIDQLELQPLPPPGTGWGPPEVRASSSRAGHGPGSALDGDPATFWAADPGERHPWLSLDFGGEREFGGLVVDWVEGREASDYAVEVSSDARDWSAIRTVRGGNGGRDHLYLPETEARHVRLRVGKGASGGVAVREIRVEPLEWSASLETFFQAVARDAPRGSYPRGMSGEQAYWTVVGLDGDPHEALVGEDGMVETGKAAFSVEPFLFAGGRLVTWSDVAPEQSLDAGSLPIPSVLWRIEDLELTITAFASGSPGASEIVVRYRLRNLGSRRERARLYLALRPFQVNPPSQTLNTPGGTAPVRELRFEGRAVRVNGDRWVASLTPPSAFGAATFDQGDIVEFLRAGRLPARRRVSDPFERASGALEYRLDLAPGAERDVCLLIPLGELRAIPAVSPRDAAVRQEVERRLARCREDWEERLGRVRIELPDSEVVRTLESQLAYVLVNRDGPAIQPGSRAYERSWIRDGSLTCTALLRLGHPEEAREFIEWFAPFQYADGKVPCCADARGADPVPEHDSSGQFIYLVAEYFRMTGDRKTLERMWPHVAMAAAYLDSLRQTRRTPEYRAPGRAAFFGILPPSISHEGYSAKPMHSYWDDFFALRGFKDAAYVARTLGLDDEQRRLAAIRDEFQRELIASIQAAMALHRIDYLPGAADLGDFDATSTAIALDPVQAASLLPRAALHRTFEKYWEFFRDRRDGRIEWEAFTPYEVRLIGAFVRLGWRDRAQELLRYFMSYRRPPGWAQWAEVAWRDEKTPHFIGDLPHTWVGSDFVRSVLDLLVYAREEDEALVIGAGVPWDRLSRSSGVRVRGLRTPQGALGFAMRADGEGAVEVRIEEGLRVPPGGIVVSPPSLRGFARATIDGSTAEVTPDGEVVVRKLPATVRFHP